MPPGLGAVGIERITMPWYIYSMLTSFSFVGLYLCIRWLTGKGFAPKQILLFMVGFALLGFFGVTAPSLRQVVNSDNFLGFLAAAAFAGLFSSIGHWADFEAIKRAPNPGFATAIRNCSILPVTILSVFLFDSSFNLQKLLGIFVILAGIIALMIERKSFSHEKAGSQSAGTHWVSLAFLALASYTLAVFGMKKATLLGFAPPEICLGIYIVNFIFFSIICRKEIKGYFQNKAKLRFFLPAAIICAGFAFAVNLLNVKGISVAPNPGYHEAIKNTNVLFVTLLAIPLFSASIDKQKIMGVISIVIGIVVLVI
jgi:drug/metabolite transporter (DMT)-like permease